MKRFAVLGVLVLALSVTSIHTNYPLTLAWAPPYPYAVLWWAPVPGGACAVREWPEPETVLECGESNTIILYAGDGATPGMIVRLEQGKVVVNRATLGGRVALPLVEAP